VRRVIHISAIGASAEGRTDHGRTMSDLYLTLKLIHILGAAVLFGTGLGIAFFMLMAHRTGNAETINQVARIVVIADSLFTASAVIGYSLVQKPNPKLKLVQPYKPYYPGIIGAGVRKDDTQLLADLNSGLAELKKSPKYLEILKKYGLGEANMVK